MKERLDGEDFSVCYRPSKYLSNAPLTFPEIKVVPKLWPKNRDFEGLEKHENEAISREKKFSGCRDPSQKLRRQILVQKSPIRKNSIEGLKLESKSPVFTNII